MYEPAMGGPDSPIWHLDGGRTLFIGPLRYNASHQHGAPVFLAGLYGAFRLRVAGRAWISCRTAMIPAGLPHELDLGGDPLGVLYVEPDLAGRDALVPLLGDTCEEDGALIGRSGETRAFRAVFESRQGAVEAGPAFADLVRHANGRARRGMDERVARAVAILAVTPDGPMPVADLARAVGLSASRFQHLFTKATGVPYRRYRAWMRMRRAIDAVIAGSNFTAAAHAAGFADQAHMAHDFRRTFGAPASGSLLNIRR